MGTAAYSSGGGGGIGKLPPIEAMEERLAASATDTRILPCVAWKSVMAA